MPITHKFRSKDEAQSAKQRLQKFLPAVQSAYQPSGHMPMAAFSALAAAAAFRILMLWVSDLFPDAAAKMLQNVFGTGAVGAICALLGATTVVMAVAVVAHRRSVSVKFCEGCQVYMRSEE